VRLDDRAVRVSPASDQCAGEHRKQFAKAMARCRGNGMSTNVEV